MDNPFDDFVSKDKAPLCQEPAAPTRDKPAKKWLLWGDGVKIREQQGSWCKVRSRAATGWVRRSDLGGTSLLEYYFIDVGQGDGVLIKTPDFRHIMIDGGWPRKSQDTGKNAADFVDWKFCKDYGKRTIMIDALVCSHNDQDHYGGLWDLLNAELSHELDASKVEIENFYHAGVSWWTIDGERVLGRYEETSSGESFWTDLLNDRESLENALRPGAFPKLQGEWKKFLRCVASAVNAADEPTPVQRLSSFSEFMPGFEPGDGSPAIKVLAPVEFEIDGKPAVRRFDDITGFMLNSQNTNGNSLLLRVDFGNSRVLLTGDLNTQSQQSLLDDYDNDPDEEFKCDVAKSCHHGSGDISYKFLEALEPAITVISSGDNEGHDHPKPEIVAASATTGYKQFSDGGDKLVSPLVFSTELARSVSLGKPTQLNACSGGSCQEYDGADLKESTITYRETKSGARYSKKGTKRIANSMIVADLIYGLVNVRTDGSKLLCATLDEKDKDWRIHKLDARF